MPELISMAQEDEGSKIPLWERRLMKLVTGHLAGFMLPGPDQACPACLSTHARVGGPGRLVFCASAAGAI